jgi:hypothetical protein
VKQFFRYFRGEFTGKYLYAAAASPNLAAQDIADEFIYHTLFTWKLDDETTKNEAAIRDEDLIGIAKIAGLFQPRVIRSASMGSISFTRSCVVNGRQRSERGLMDMEYENHKFVRTEQDEYPDDIATEASTHLRSTLVPHGTKPVGYVRAGKPLYTLEGDVIWENVYPEPPSDGSDYVPYYGEKFLVHEEHFYGETPLPIPIFKLLFECVQRIRYNGPTIKSLLDVTEILGEGYIQELEFEPHDRYTVCYYSLDQDLDVYNRERRFGAWETICKQKFKQIVFTARE